VKVWRVEHETSTAPEGWPCGPYCGPERVGGLAFAHSDDEHPGPYWDRTLNYIDNNEICGLVSREALDKWFTDWHDALERRGFVISVYEVPYDDARIGEYGQTVFKFSAATRVGAEFWGVIG
jgi:hypothetical protein